jgi:hypothetical protein
MYVQKITLSMQTSSGDFGVEQTTQIPYGFLHGLTYRPDATVPFVANSSARIQLRLGSTTGRIIARSSSGLLNVIKYYQPRYAIHGTTSGAIIYATSSANMSQVDRIALCNDTIYACLKGSSSGPTQKGAIDIYLA